MDKFKSEPDYALNLNYNTLTTEIKELLNSMSPQNVKEQLIKRGYEEEKVEVAIHNTYKSAKKNRIKNSNIILFKDFFDKIGYGFASPLLIYVLLYTLNTSILLFGVIAAIRSFITLFTSPIVKSYQQNFNIDRKVTSTFGTLFGLSFLLLAMAMRIQSTIIFTVGIILSSFFLVIHGDLYSNYIITKVKGARSTISAKIVSYFGLIITALAFVAAGFFLDFSSITINLGITAFTIPGYLLELEIVAFAFIFSSYVFSFVNPDLSLVKQKIKTKISKKEFFTNYFRNMKHNFSKFLANKDIKMLFYGTLFSGSLQTIIATFSGLYIFESIRGTVINPFFHLVIIFGVGIIAASIGPSIARSFTKIFGETPMLIFGVFLVAIFPISIYFNISYSGLIIAHAVSVIGASILSIVQSFLINNSLNEEEKKTYFSAITPLIAMIMPFIIILLTLLVYVIGFKEIFLVTAILILLLVTPFYFSLVINAHKAHNSSTSNSFLYK
jgi:hypothetical protein